MATELKLRRDTYTDINAGTPAEGEPLFDTTNKRLVAGDAVKTGGIPHGSYKDIQNQSFTYAAASGTDTIAITLSPAPGAYAAGQSFKFKAAATNTATSVTLNVNSLGAKNIKKIGSAGKETLAVGDIVSGGIYTVDYDGTDFIVSGGVGTTGPGLVLIDSQTAASASGIAFASDIDGTYNEYLFVVEQLYAETAGQSIVAQVFSGAAWQGSAYSNSLLIVHDGSATASAATSGTNIPVTGAMAAAHGSGEVRLFNPNSSTIHKRIISDINYNASSGTVAIARASCAGVWGSTSVVTGFRLIPTSGNLTGTVRMYGVATS